MHGKYIQRAQRNKAYHYIVQSKRAQGGEGPLQDQIKAQMRGGQAHTQSKSL